MILHSNVKINHCQLNANKYINLNRYLRVQGMAWRLVIAQSQPAILTQTTCRGVNCNCNFNCTRNWKWKLKFKFKLQLTSLLGKVLNKRRVNCQRFKLRLAKFFGTNKFHLRLRLVLSNSAHAIMVNFLRKFLYFLRFLIH